MAGQQAVQSNGDAHGVAVPQCTLVAGPIDLTTGGEGAKTPMRKLTPKMTGTCLIRKGVGYETEKETNAGKGVFSRVGISSRPRFGNEFT